MGCGASANQVHVVDANGTVKKSAPSKPKPSRKKITDADTCSISSEDRGNSATSKISRRSGDSGFDDEEELLKQREAAFLARPLPSLHKPPAERVEEKQLLAALHEEGLIQRPIGRGAFSVSFEVMSEMSPGTTIKKPPPRLAKLELMKKKKKKVLTEAEIRQKLERAEQRRKDQEQQRLEKIHALQKTDIQTALAEQTATRESLEVVTKTKDELAAENRERKLREKLAKLKAKQEHAEAVKLRRLQAQAAAAASDQPSAQPDDQPSFTDHQPSTTDGQPSTSGYQSSLTAGQPFTDVDQSSTTEGTEDQVSATGGSTTGGQAPIKPSLNDDQPFTTDDGDQSSFTEQA